jgi:DNA-3-methyladenine glycosylase II
MNATQFLLNADPVLARVMAMTAAPQIQSTHDLFFDLLSCVIEQQIHYRSSKNIFLRMLSRAGLNTLTPENFEQFEEHGLPTVKLSQRKLETVASIWTFWQENQIEWEKLSDTEVREKLSAIHGIGPWTMDMILLYTLERPDVFPPDDFRLKQAMTDLYGLNAQTRLKAQMLDIAQRWGAHKSLAVKYLLAWKEQSKGIKL